MIPIAYTSEEGGYWKPWPKNIRFNRHRHLCWSRRLIVSHSVVNWVAGWFMHSIKFTNGQEWDAINGYRT